MIAHFEFGEVGLKRAIERGDVIVVVDVLSFSSAVTTGVAHGFKFYAASTQEEAEQIAQQTGAVIAVSARGGGIQGQYSLSPMSYLDEDGQGKTVVLPSPNGATFTKLAQGKCPVFIGCILNNEAVGTAAVQYAKKYGFEGISVVACGEILENGERRFAVEDQLGAGAVLFSNLRLYATSEAKGVAAFYHFTESEQLLWTIIRDGESGKDLEEKRRQADIMFSIKHRYVCAPYVDKNGLIVAYEDADLYEHSI